MSRGRLEKYVIMRLSQDGVKINQPRVNPEKRGEKMGDEKREILKIPFVVHEANMARIERVNKRLWVACSVCFVSLVGTNLWWIRYK